MSNIENNNELFSPEEMQSRTICPKLFEKFEFHRTIAMNRVL